MTVLSWAGLVTNILVLGFSYRLVARELRKRHEAERCLTELANIDPLTGLHNRRSVGELLRIAHAHAVRQDASLSVVMIDIDYFKAYNDTYGHPAGDEVLHSTGLILRSLVRVDDFVGRYGGEEFIVLLPNTDATTACLVAERIRSGIAAWDRGRRLITVSLGVSTLVSRSTAIDVLVAQSDKALYQSKQNGRDCVTHYDAVEPVMLPISVHLGSSAVRAG
jgi:diguanylate cyclase (GGDEF)-like protein